MTHDDLLTRHGLFDAKVPRYTSYPPATRFQIGVGQASQVSWMQALPIGDDVSVYVHIPFCKRLCWFCACRTQGTRTLSPVEGYINTVCDEIAQARRHLPSGIRMARLHLGGGTPTLLSSVLMDRLLARVFGSFETAENFEFSVEIDPTDAAPDLLQTLSNWGMNRASIGVQDFTDEVQRAIGRLQSFEQTLVVVEQLRAQGLRSLNMDLLYGLPFQTNDSMAATLEKVLSFAPDRLALFGYAHVPNMSKRQVMIDTASLPSTRMRYDLSQMAAKRLEQAGFVALGIDHFALPSDGLARAKMNRTLRRNFQGYTDDPCDTLIGFGTSAISHYREGFVQNAVATGAYKRQIEERGFAGHKGYVLTRSDRVIGAMVQALMCYGSIDLDAPELCDPDHQALVEGEVQALMRRFPDALTHQAQHLRILPKALPLARIIAATMDAENAMPQRYSLAV